MKILREHWVFVFLKMSKMEFFSRSETVWPVGPHCANYQWNRRPLTASGFLKQRFDSIDQLVGRFVLKLNHPLLKITLAIWHSGHQISPASIYRRGGVRVRVKTVKSSSQLLISPSGHDLVELLITLRASSDCYPRSG